MTQICLLCTSGDREMKIKSKRDFEVEYSFIKLFARNLEIIGSSSQNWVKLDQLCTRYANFGLFDPILAIITSEIGFLKLVLRSQYISLKVSINSCFGHFITIFR